MDSLLEGPCCERREISAALDWQTLTARARQFAKRWCRVHEDYEAIAQEALLRLIQHTDNVRSPETWLFVITRRLARDARAQTLKSFEHAKYAAASDFSSDRSHAERTTAALRVILKDRQLSIHDRRVVIWAAVGYTHAEIAERLGRKRQAIGQDITRACARLQRRT
jgi:RNA polymerase sigma factor (sigma-70 family)